MKRIITIIAAFIFFLGVINYPFVSRIYNRMISGDVVEAYDSDVKKLSDTEKEKEWEAAREYNKSLAVGLVTLGDAFEETEETSEIYQSLLNLNGSGVMGILDIPKINVTLPIYHGTGEDSLQRGAGHMEGTSLPVGGESTHAVISAHRGLPTKEMFTSLDLMEEGDVFTIRVFGETLAYRIYAVETVRPEVTDSLTIVPGRDLVTLVTCTPYGRNTHRLLVHAERIPDEEAVREGIFNDGVNKWTLKAFIRSYWWVLMDIILILWLTFLVKVMLKREKKKKGTNQNN